MTTMIDAIDKIVVITGAGFSAPSGLPVYRGSGTGWIDGDLEQKMRANRYGNHLQELWPHWHALAAKANNAEPNLAHLALTRWEELVTARGGWLTIVTQNVDGLHSRAGGSDVIEAHGTITQARKLKQSSELFDYRPALPGIDDGPPAAPDGSTRTRPDIVLFGEKPRGMERTSQLVQEADLVLFAGTSGRVWPVAGLLNIANDSRPTTMLLNEQEWSTGHFDIVVIDDVLALDELVPR